MRRCIGDFELHISPIDLSRISPPLPPFHSSQRLPTAVAADEGSATGAGAAYNKQADADAQRAARSYDEFVLERCESNDICIRAVFVSVFFFCK